MVKRILFILAVSLFAMTNNSYAGDKIELKMTRITGNKELPKILYVVPWKDIKRTKHNERKLELHSLFGDLFDPVLPLQSSMVSNQ